jgi:hypothetical protein
LLEVVDGYVAPFDAFLQFLNLAPQLAVLSLHT